MLLWHKFISQGALRKPWKRKQEIRTKQKISWLYATLTSHIAFMLIIDFSHFSVTESQFPHPVHTSLDAHRGTMAATTS